MIVMLGLVVTMQRQDFFVCLFRDGEMGVLFDFFFVFLIHFYTDEQVPSGVDLLFKKVV